MNHRAWLAALLLFLITVLVRLPASWALRLAPGSVSCEQPAGTLWHGGCARLQAAGMAIGPVRWSLHALPLLIARIDAEVESDDARLPGQARLALRTGGRLDASTVRAQLTLSPELLPSFPEGWQGQVRLDLATLSIAEGRLKSLQGTVDVASLRQLNPPMALGSYELRFAPAASAADAVAGTLRDTAGPLSVAGTLRYTASGGYEINGTVAARSDATPELTKAVEYLGEADAQGRRQFSLAGTL
jgi:hypothetical protein